MSNFTGNEPLAAHSPDNRVGERGSREGRIIAESIRSVGGASHRSSESIKDGGCAGDIVGHNIETVSRLAYL